MMCPMENYPSVGQILLTKNHLRFYFSNLDLASNNVLLLIIWIQIRHVQLASFYLISKCVCLITRIFYHFQETVPF